VGRAELIKEFCRGKQALYFSVDVNKSIEILIEEFGREHATYYEILSAIAEGKRAQKEIADFTHRPVTSLPSYLRDLADLGFVQ
jgi:AAA+ ATPase superfamily predicted ATPase